MRRRPKWTLGPEVAAWIETFCVHGPGDVLGQPVSLTREEKRFLAWAYEVDKDGSRIVRRAVRGLPKGSRKTEFAAWVALAEMAGPVRFDRWEQAEKGKRPRGKRVVEGSQGQPRANPLYKQVQEFQAEARQLEDRFGLSPKARLALGISMVEAAMSMDALNQRLADRMSADDDLWDEE